MSTKESDELLAKLAEVRQIRNDAESLRNDLKRQNVPTKSSAEHPTKPMTDNAPKKHYQAKHKKERTASREKFNQFPTFEKQPTATDDELRLTYERMQREQKSIPEESPPSKPKLVAVPDPQPLQLSEPVAYKEYVFVSSTDEKDKLLAVERPTAANASVSEPLPPVADAPFADKTAVDDPPASVIPVEDLDDSELMRKMLASVQDLTAEVKQLRSQIEAKPYSAAYYPSERPPGIAEAADNARENPQKKKKGKGSVVSDILFYLVIAILIFCGLTYGGLSNGAPKSFAGYSAFTVLTGSMQREIPKGSLVITKVTEASELRVGDDITYLVNPTTTVTHRIIGIMENYENTGQRAFQTKGIMNDVADKDPVPEANVVGRVIYHDLTLGKIATFVTDNIVPMIIFLVLFIIFFAVFKKFLRGEGKFLRRERR